MSGAELTGIERVWLLLLAFTAATLAVAALRRPCRRLFGAERAFQLWLLPPLAMLVGQLPHAAVDPTAALPGLVVMITSAASAWPGQAAPVIADAWRGWVLSCWLAGCAGTLVLAGFMQWRYRIRLRGAVPLHGLPSRWPVLRAASTDVGPALVGAWRACVVLPADFDSRYDPAEQMLILAHETMHARRHDGAWCLFGQVAAALLWFHPLAWWALGALRRDQELACDAAVLRTYGARRRSYANAMLKTCSAGLALPVGCRWSPRHPLTERIAMLKLSSPSRRRRRAGMITGVALVLVVAGSVYAASAPAGAGKAPAVAGQEYQLDMKIELATDDGHKRHAEKSVLALCMAPGKAAGATFPDWTLEATTVPAGAGEVRIALGMNRRGAASPERSQLQGRLGVPLHATGTSADGQHSYVVDITPRAGCPARAMADAGIKPVMVSEHVVNGTARAVAESVAAKAGWELVNPEALEGAPVSLNFEDVPSQEALRLVAGIVGMKPQFDSKQVRFTPK